MKTSPLDPLSRVERGNDVNLNPKRPNPNPFPTREGAIDLPSHVGKGNRVRSKVPPSHSGKGSGVRSSPIFGQNIDSEKLARAKELRHYMTQAERILWRELRNNQFRGRHFRRQQVIEGFIADFYCHDEGLVIEVDGVIHKGQAAYDAERDTILTARGLCVIHVTNEEVLGNSEAVLVRIADNLTLNDLTLNPFPKREETSINSPSHSGKGPGVRSPGVK